MITKLHSFARHFLIPSQTKIVFWLPSKFYCYIFGIHFGVIGEDRKAVEIIKFFEKDLADKNPNKRDLEDVAKPLNNKVSHHEVRIAIEKLKDNKVPGPYQVELSFIIKGPSQNRNKVTNNNYEFCYFDVDGNWSDSGTYN